MAPGVVKKDRNFQYIYQYNYQHKLHNSQQNNTTSEHQSKRTEAPMVTIYFFSLFTLYRFVILVNASNE